MKKLILSILIILLCLSACTLIACNGGDDTTTTNGDNVTTLPSYEYNITYELNGGTNNAENPTGYNTGDIITLGFPTKEDYMFAGWYTDSALTNEIKEINNKEENLTLYAKWAPYDDMFRFTEKDGYYSVRIAPKYSVDTVIIPTEYNSLPVTEIISTLETHQELFKKVFISHSIMTIHRSAFSSWAGTFEKSNNLEYVEVDKNNLHFKSIDGVLYSKDGKTIIKYPPCKIGESFDIPEEVVVIGDFAFSDVVNLKNITIPDGVKTIGEGAFYKGASLKAVSIPNGIIRIEHSTFLRCISLESINIPDSVEFIGSHAFSFCSSLSNITIPGSVKYIGTWAFNNCTGLESIKICDGVTTIDIGAFNECTSIESVFIPQSVTELHGSAFQDCPQLTVYCEAEKMPAGWQDFMEKNVKEIVWGYKES